MTGGERVAGKEWRKEYVIGGREWKLSGNSF